MMITAPHPATLPDGIQGTSAPTTHALSRLPATVRPDRNLLTYYLLRSLLLGPFFLFAFVPGYFRWRSLRYDVDDEGITMRWGVLFRREVSLTYARIQDIHLTSNVFERWLGLATIQVQTASGSASAEMTIEGLRQHAVIRDFFYERMRGAREQARGQHTDARPLLSDGSIDELTATLREIAREVRALRGELTNAREETHDL